VWALSAAIEGWLYGRLGSVARIAMLASAILLLYPPQYRFFGLSGFAVTVVGAACVAAIYLMRIRSRESLAPAVSGQ
jgi:TRAP-type uncharacterized transport system fused permease subunit